MNFFLLFKKQRTSSPPLSPSWGKTNEKKGGWGILEGVKILQGVFNEGETFTVSYNVETRIQPAVSYHGSGKARNGNFVLGGFC